MLDISLNKIDFRAALVIEDALENRKSLTELDISHNPLGFLGMRNMLPSAYFLWLREIWHLGVVWSSGK